MTIMISDRTTLSECEDVSVVYGEGEARVEALCDFDFGVRKGESVALWGRSGSGKTTILHVLGGLVAPTSGTVKWRGQPLSTLDVTARAKARRDGIAYVFQGLAFGKGLTDHILKKGHGLLVHALMNSFRRDCHILVPLRDLCRQLCQRRLGLTPGPKGHEGQKEFPRNLRRAFDKAGATCGGFDVVGSQEVC